MNKAFTRFFTDRGMTVTGKRAYGTADGYEVNAVLHMMDPTAPLRFQFSCFATPEQRTAIEEAVGAANIPGMPLAAWTPWGLIIGLNAITAKKLLERLPGIYETLLQILKTNGARGVGYCPICGEPLPPDSKQYQILESQVTLDPACLEQINAEIRSENDAYNAAPNNYLRGFGGALIGGLAGALVAYILFQIGFISAISVFVAIALGSFLYQKFGGKANKGMIAIVSATSFVFGIAAVFGAYLLEIRAMLDAEGVSMSVFEAFGTLMEDQKFLSAFMGDMAFTVLFSMIGVVCETVVLSRKIKRETEIQ